MEDTLRVLVRELSQQQACVLILVLMEDTLREVYYSYSRNDSYMS